ncbi:MAG: T9SS type A sorting domain-containing protein, partial [Panacibacter sp.]
KAGSYLLIVTDAAGCSLSQSFTITQPTKLKLIVLQKTKPSCRGGANGSIQVNAVGGTGISYLYSIGNGPFTANIIFTNLNTGTYSISVRDANGCTVTSTVNLGDGRGACAGVTSQQESESLVNNPKYDVSKNGLSIKVLPNPSTTNFTLMLQSNSNENVQVIVSDMYGKKLYQIKGAVNQQYSFGQNFVNGLYIVQVIQGNNIQTLKLIKGKG